MNDTYKLYWRAGSGSIVAEAALRLAGAPFEGICVPTKAEQKGDAFLAINPAGKIPVLVLPSGQTVMETMAILLVVDEHFPQARLMPPVATAERATALQWLALMATSTYGAALRYYYPDRHTDDPSAEAIAAVKKHAAADMDRDFALITAALKGPFLLGETMCAADIYAAMLADWHEPATRLPAMRQLKAELLKSLAVQAAWTSHAFGDW